MSKKDLKIQLFKKMTDIYKKSPKGRLIDGDWANLEKNSRKKIEACRSKALICAKCSHKYFSDQEREVIRKIMKYSGKRVIFTNPILTIKYTGSLIKSS